MFHLAMSMTGLSWFMYILKTISKENVMRSRVSRIRVLFCIIQRELCIYGFILTAITFHLEGRCLGFYKGTT